MSEEPQEFSEHRECMAAFENTKAIRTEYETDFASFWCGWLASRAATECAVCGPHPCHCIPPLPTSDEVIASIGPGEVAPLERGCEHGDLTAALANLEADYAARNRSVVAHDAETSDLLADAKTQLAAAEARIESKEAIIRLDDQLIADLEKQRDELRAVCSRLERIVTDEHEHGIQCTECGNQNAMVRSVCGKCTATLPHAVMGDQINALRAQLADAVQLVADLRAEQNSIYAQGYNDAEGEYRDSNQQAADDLAELRRERADAAKALREYGDHAGRCAIRRHLMGYEINNGAPCTCGLAEALATLEPKP